MFMKDVHIWEDYGVRVIEECRVGTGVGQL